MPENIYSKVNPEVLLLSVNRNEEINDNRTDVCPEDKFLQISTKKIAKATKFKPHKHNILQRNIDNTHECWIILSGCIKATFYDLNNEQIYETLLKNGDCAVVYNAGHSFEVLEDNTKLYEVKNGPYYGQSKDKTFF
jgi:hypothetical protein